MVTNNGTRVHNAKVKRPSTILSVSNWISGMLSPPLFGYRRKEGVVLSNSEVQRTGK